MDQNEPAHVLLDKYASLGYIPGFIPIEGNETHEPGLYGALGNLTFEPTKRMDGIALCYMVLREAHKLARQDGLNPVTSRYVN